MKRNRTKKTLETIKVKNDFELISASSNRNPDQVLMTTTNRQQPNQGNLQFQKMKCIRQHAIMKPFIKKMKFIIPQNNTPAEVLEQWQMEDDDQQEIHQNIHQSLDEKIFNLYPLAQLLSIIQGISIVYFLWIISISLVFQMQFGYQYIVILAIQLVNISSKGYILVNNKELIKFAWRSKNKEIVCPLVIILCSLIMIINQYIGFSILQNSIFTNLLILVVFVTVSNNVSKYFESVQIYAEEKKLIKQLRIIQLFAMLLTIAHIFGLILYSALYVTPEGESTWVQSHNLHQKPWYVQYIYSVYWALTTIVTVGYGDITPQNYVEVITVVFVQIFGTSFFGYMISVIGEIVDKKNKKNDELDNYQQTIAKLKDHYNLSTELCHMMKNDIKDKYKQQQVAPLKKIQEIQLLDYIDPTVKKTFIHETNIRVIKKSIFFLIYFTVNFQNEIALKLIRVIYKKGDEISNLDQTKERKMVIINHGKINLYIEKKHNNSSKKKLVKIIYPEEGKPAFNVYGYSSLILNRDIAVYADTEEITSGYELKRSDIVECMSKNMIDYEGFHQIKEKMLLNSIKQSIEAPILKQPQYHFLPNILILCKKLNRKFNQKRNKKSRRSMKCKLQIVDKLSVNRQNSKFIFKLSQSLCSNKDFGKMLQIQTKKQQLQQFSQLLSVGQLEDEKTILIDEDNIILKNSLQLDHVKIFDHFMKAFNINVLSVNYQRSCASKSYVQRRRYREIISKKI